jgi:hypothetical protein
MSKSSLCFLSVLLWAGSAAQAQVPVLPVAAAVPSAQSQVQSQAAQRAFLSWEKGESTGNYTDFKAALSPDFSLFSHPVQPARGVYTGSKAKDMMAQLIDQRGQNPNHLKFANVRQHAGQNSYIFEFDSEGKVSGYPYKGWNAIQLTIGADNKVTGFREYLGDIDPAWFQKR